MSCHSGLKPAGGLDFSPGLTARHNRAFDTILDRQLVQQPIAQAAMELFASLCVLSRRDAQPHAQGPCDREQAPWESASAALFLEQSARRVRESLERIHHHDEEAITRTARRILDSDPVADEEGVPSGEE